MVRKEQNQVLPALAAPLPVVMPFADDDEERAWVENAKRIERQKQERPS